MCKTSRICELTIRVIVDSISVGEIPLDTLGKSLLVSAPRQSRGKICFYRRRPRDTDRTLTASQSASFI